MAEAAAAAAVSAVRTAGAGAAAPDPLPDGTAMGAPLVVEAAAALREADSVTAAVVPAFWAMRLAALTGATADSKKAPGALAITAIWLMDRSTTMAFRTLLAGLCHSERSQIILCSLCCRFVPAWEQGISAEERGPLGATKDAWQGDAVYGIAPVMAALASGRRVIHKLYVQEGVLPLCYSQPFQKR